MNIQFFAGNKGLIKSSVKTSLNSLNSLYSVYSIIKPKNDSFEVTTDLIDLLTFAGDNDVAKFILGKFGITEIARVLPYASTCGNVEMVLKSLMTPSERSIFNSSN
ncbi:MAG: hypothetical protein A2X09_14200 [Bacteroidetes bacterium GWF2_43_11]|nr:MAG: hypothetical protein A2X09_14200 [Bacteroidetes bacterium GWF2_43_11]